MQTIINYIPYFFVAWYSVVFYNLCYMKLNNFQFTDNKKKIILVILFTTIIVFINNSYNNLWLKLILTSLAFCINYKILFKDNFKKIIINYVIIYTIIIILEIIVTNFLLDLGFISDNTGGFLYTILKFILSLIIPTIEYIIFSIKFIREKINLLINLFVDKVNFVHIAYLFFITFYILGILNFENFTSKNSIQLIVILFLIFCILFAIIIKSKTEEEFLKASNKKLIEYNEKYSQFLDEYKIYKHNINNKLVGIKSFGNKKVNALIDDLLEEETNFSIKNNNLNNVPKGIKGIVAEKLYNTKINVIIDNKMKKDPFINLSPKIFNSVSESIGICLDNAVEASLETNEPIVILDFYDDEENIYIKIGNSFCNKIDIEELGKKNYSTKNRNSGFGLFSIIKNNRIREKISIINNFYYIELKIKKHF